MWRNSSKGDLMDISYLLRTVTKRGRFWKMIGMGSCSIKTWRNIVKSQRGKKTLPIEEQNLQKTKNKVAEIDIYPHITSK